MVFEPKNTSYFLTYFWNVQPLFIEIELLEAEFMDDELTQFYNI